MFWVEAREEGGIYFYFTKESKWPNTELDGLF